MGYGKYCRNPFFIFICGLAVTGLSASIAIYLWIGRVRELVGLDITKQKKLLQKALINNWKNVYINGEEPEEDNSIKELKDFYGNN